MRRWIWLALLAGAGCSECETAPMAGGTYGAGGFRPIPFDSGWAQAGPGRFKGVGTFKVNQATARDTGDCRSACS